MFHPKLADIALRLIRKAQPLFSEEDDRLLTVRDLEVLQMLSEGLAKRRNCQSTGGFRFTQTINGCAESTSSFKSRMSLQRWQLPFNVDGSRDGRTPLRTPLVRSKPTATTPCHQCALNVDFMCSVFSQWQTRPLVEDLPRLSCCAIRCQGSRNVVQGDRIRHIENSDNHGRRQLQRVLARIGVRRNCS